MAFLTQPHRMNGWSTAKIMLRDLGAGDHPAGVGAIRTVDLPSGGRLFEVVTKYEPGRFEYRIFATPLVASHQGAIDVNATSPNACELNWRIRARLDVPGAGFIARSFLLKELGNSLDRLQELVKAVKVADVELGPAPLLAMPAEPPDELVARARSCARAQRDVGASLKRDDDPRHWFATTYFHVTTAMIDAIEQGIYEHPAWIARLIIDFHDLYWRNVRAKPAAQAPHWRHAFDRMAGIGRKHRDPYAQMMRCVWQGMRAHIEYDLPSAIRGVHAEHYAAFDLRRLRPDYIAMGPVFRDASAAMMQTLPIAVVPRWARFVDRVLPPTLKDAYLWRRYYHLPKKRLESFREALK